VEILAVAIRLFTHADATGASQHAIYLRDKPFGLVEITLLIESLIERNENYEAEASVQR
jgi:hypothetical protein